MRMNLAKARTIFIDSTQRRLWWVRILESITVFLFLPDLLVGFGENEGVFLEAVEAEVDVITDEFLVGEVGVFDEDVTRDDVGFHIT